ncbi:GPW/gp25 family protein [Pseudoduganella chitinolytica]|uniref:GPW/gp25 family protein n=1 Tax=Pseudoduganella chitinolytica TaxID=34070 RepID=A0ABY8BG82_9BURK|nr:GPW/gp25 family protein [Pseudoduganella chitinolytica]WEF34308.1 GPW/gp25 family protein [Pseudoduganella chitinolytica]
MTSRSFLGTGWAFPPSFSRAGGTTMVDDDVDIRESLVILLSTRPGERVMRPLYGCNLHALVFEQVSETVVGAIRQAVASAVERCEPRVQVVLVTVLPGPDLDGVLPIEIVYRVRATNTTHNLVYPFYVEAAR